MIRSLITLKALTYAPTGGIVAAPTTSLPEQIGGVRNWDYRFCWLRDATLTLLALMNAGYYAEARRLARVAAARGRRPPRAGADHVRHCRRAAACRMGGAVAHRHIAQFQARCAIGNEAHNQLQLDVYGEVMDALHQARRGGLAASAVRLGRADRLPGSSGAAWTMPDESIWEVRSGRRHFTYSKVMAWVAFDRAIKSAEEFGLEGPLDRWRRLRAEIHAEVCQKGFDPEQGQLRAVLWQPGA